jgi:DNA-binding beta-propeller fold protein YncE
MQKSGTSTARVVVGGTLVGLVALVVAGRLLSSGLQPPAARPTPATTVPAASVPSTTAPVVPVVATVQVGAEPTQVAVGAGGVWVGVWATGKLVRIDPASNRVVARIPVGRPQESPIAIAVADRAVWVVDFGDARVLRIDPATNRVVARIPVRGGAGGIGVGAGAVWVTSGEGGDQRHGWVQRLDPARNRVEATIGVPGGLQLWGVAVSGQSVWVGNALGRLWRLDPRRNQVTATVRATQTQGASPPGVGHLAAGADAIWTGADGQLLRLNPRSGHPLATIPWVAGSHDAYSGVGAGSVWFASGDRLVRVDPATNRLVATTEIPELDSAGIAAGADAVWVLSGDLLVRIDPARIPS